MFAMKIKRALQLGLTTSLVCGGLLWTSSAVGEDDVADLLKMIAQAGPDGRGSAAARNASEQLAARGIDVLPKLLQGIDTDNVVVANWCRVALDAIVERERKRANPQFPVAVLQQYAADPQRQGRARRHVLRLLDDIEPEFRETLLLKLVEDPEFRRDAIDLVLSRGDEAKARKDEDAAAREYQRAFRNARDVRQITTAADRLKAIGVDVDIVEHMGFITRWRLLGPFDAPERSGFDTKFPPESAVDLAARYNGKDDKTISWKRYDTADRLGQVNLVLAIAPVKEAVGYAHSEFISPRRQTVELRCGADDNLSVWLNGEQILARRQWLNGTRLDRFTAPAELKKGKNQILVKVCQGPQHKNPAVPNNWSMQLRFCDRTGASVGLKSTLRPLVKND